MHNPMAKGSRFQTVYALFLSLFLAATACPGAETDSGYRGIWYDLGQAGPYGSKYSGGLGTTRESTFP